jgi:hypothetical protein
MRWRDLAHQRALLALVVEHERRLHLQFPHAQFRFGAGKQILHLIPEQDTLLAVQSAA